MSMLLENSSLANMVEAMDPWTFKIDLTFEQTQYSNICCWYKKVTDELSIGKSMKVKNTFAYSKKCFLSIKLTSYNSTKS